MEKKDEDAALLVMRAQYYMTSANTLVLTGTIFILGFVTALGVTGPRYDLLRMIMLGLVPFGLIALYDGITRYFQAQKLMKQTRAAGAPRRNPVLDAGAFVMLMAIFLAVNWLLYGTYVPSLLTVVVLVISAVVVGWIKITVDKQGI
jgi:hypothetical protein